MTLYNTIYNFKNPVRYFFDIDNLIFCITIMQLPY